MKKYIKIHGMTLEVCFDYQPFEPMELEYPGADESVVAEAVYHKGEDVTGIFSEEFLETLEEKVLKELRECNEPY